MFGIVRLVNCCHPCGVLIEDPDLSDIDSRSETSGMTASNVSNITTQSSPLSTKSKSAWIKCRNERQYSRMFIMDDEQSDVGHGCPFSAVTSKILS